MTENTRYETVAIRPPGEEPLTPYSSNWREDEKQDEIPKKKGSTWSSTFDILKRKTGSTNNDSTHRSKATAWTTLRQFNPTGRSWRQVLAFSLLSCCGIIPFFLLGHFARSEEHPKLFAGAFADKQIDCSDDFYEGGSGALNSTVAGAESLFVLDYRLGRYTFATVKTIDVAWDILVGRGVQAFAWWVSYIVFSDALLAVIERHPASFRVFKHIAFEGASLTALWALLRNLWRTRSGRTRALYAYIFVSMAYVLCIPVFLSAMTGYDSTTATYVGISDNTTTMIPVSSLERRIVIRGANNSRFAQGACLPVETEYDALDFLKELQDHNCDCEVPNGMIVPYNESKRVPYDWNVDMLATGRSYIDPFSYCVFNFPSSNQTYQVSGSDETRNCNATFNVQIRNTTYDIQSLQAAEGWCFGDVGYSMTEFMGKSRCLPDTEHPAYQWGFSTMLSAIFMIIQLAWCLSMYALWQHAQFNSKLVRNGYRLNPLRAMLVLAEATTRRTGMGIMELIQADTKTLERELYGKKKDPGATVEYEYFSRAVKGGLEGNGDNVIRRSTMAR